MAPPKPPSPGYILGDTADDRHDLSDTERVDYDDPNKIITNADDQDRRGLHHSMHADTDQPQQAREPGLEVVMFANATAPTRRTLPPQPSTRTPSGSQQSSSSHTARQGSLFERSSFDRDSSSSSRTRHQRNSSMWNYGRSTGVDREDKNAGKRPRDDDESDDNSSVVPPAKRIDTSQRGVGAVLKASERLRLNKNATVVEGRDGLPMGTAMRGPNPPTIATPYGGGLWLDTDGSGKALESVKAATKFATMVSPVNRAGTFIVPLQDDFPRRRCRGALFRVPRTTIPEEPFKAPKMTHAHRSGQDIPKDNDHCELCTSTFHRTGQCPGHNMTASSRDPPHVLDAPHTMAAISHGMCPSLKLASEATQQLFEAQLDQIKTIVIETNQKDPEQMLQEITAASLSQTPRQIQIKIKYCMKLKEPQVVSAELFARQYIKTFWIKSQTALHMWRRFPTKPDELDESKWFSEPLSPEFAEFLNRKNAETVALQQQVTVPVTKEASKPPPTGILSSAKPPTPLASREKWTAAAKGQDEAYFASCARQRQENDAKGIKFQPQIHDTFVKTNEDGVKVGEPEVMEYQARVDSPKPETKAQPAPKPTRQPEYEARSQPEPKPEAKATLPARPQPAPKPASQRRPQEHSLVLSSKNTPHIPPQSEAPQCSIKKEDCDEGACQWIWQEYLQSWAAKSAYAENAWEVSIPRSKDCYFFGESGNRIFQVLAMCPRGAHLYTEYRGNDADNQRLVIGVYVKFSKHAQKAKAKQAKFRITSGHDTNMISLFRLLFEWSTMINLGHDILFSLHLQSHNNRTSRMLANSFDTLRAEVSARVDSAKESHARAEEAERSRQELVNKAKAEHEAKMEAERVNLEKSTGEIVRKFSADRIKIRQQLKVLVAETDEYCQNDGQRWQIIVRYISTIEPDKAAWASQLMWDQGYGKARRH